MASAIPAVRIADGVELPMLGLGVFQVPDGSVTERAVSWALEAGYRHVDTAQAYGNEASVGRALAASAIARDELFVTTKFSPSARSRLDPVAEAQRSLERLGLESVDLYLVHWPQRGPTADWSAMEAALERGLSRAIGVSNFSADEIEAVRAAGDVNPAVNQIQFNPFANRVRLRQACERGGTAIEAYSPLTQGADLGDPTVAQIAAAHERTPAQILLRWAVQRGVAVIPKSIDPERIRENARIFDFELAAAEVERLDTLDRSAAAAAAVERPWWTLRAGLAARAGAVLRRRGG